MNDPSLRNGIQQNGQNDNEKCTAPELLLKIVLVGTHAHYESRGMIDEKRLEHMLHAGKQILYKSHQESDVRQNLGFSSNVWQGLSDVMDRAIPILELQSFAWKHDASNNFNGSSSDLISFNYPSLVKDIERLNDLCTIARNLLATTKKAQNLAAERGFDQQILKLIEVCVRVAARGYDGDSNVRNEERWQKVVNLYKRLLITCLQFLHNFIMHNEHRKLVLWLDLFGSVPPSEGETMNASQTYPTPGPTPESQKAQSARSERIKTTVDKIQHSRVPVDESGLSYTIDDVHALFDLMSTDPPPDGSTAEAARVLMDQIRSDMERLSGLSASQLDKNPEALLKVGAALRAQLPGRELPIRENEALQSKNPSEVSTPEPIKPIAATDTRSTMPSSLRTLNWSSLAEFGEFSEMDGSSTNLTKDDISMPRSTISAATTLAASKEDFAARISYARSTLAANDDGPFDNVEGDPDNPIDEDVRSIEAAADSLDEEDDEDDDEFQHPGDQERGLLTDVPLVLGPTEIEALPMIIQAGIVDSFGLKGGERSGSRNMQSVRCHILLASEAGRNLLRELLIFIAAWDLPDDEFYFKMMVQIMEAILKNNLMSHAYQDFGQAKDIVSPAQSVVIKILTHIFRSKYSPASGSNSNGALPARSAAALTRADVLTVRYIFSIFRGNIIPETCALINYQGEIRAGRALADEFPLNLWDMERVYEGVYQFLEFFAVLTESNDWKSLLVDWEIVYDLVTLLKELDVSIPKGSFQIPPPADENTNKATITPRISENNNPTPVSIERPYDPNAPDVPIPPLSPNAENSPASPPLTNDDPSEFEWRNLKKLIILVLSSLVWKSPTVQTQIRKHGGVECTLGCTHYDSHNPYIKEHAVMCLKFLLEGNRENQKIVEALEAREVVEETRKELEKHGMEASVGEDGKVRVVPKRARSG
ncbi:MAG: hypothetical protein Q9227_005025 [Pyrenula ochraceoflavens]